MLLTTFLSHTPAAGGDERRHRFGRLPVSPRCSEMMDE